MAYKDLDKRRLKNKERVRRYRERQSQGVKALQCDTQGVTEGVTLPVLVAPELDADGNLIPDY